MFQFQVGGKEGLVVKGGDSQSECCEFKSQHWILDGHLFNFNLL